MVGFVYSILVLAKPFPTISNHKKLWLPSDGPTHPIAPILMHTCLCGFGLAAQPKLT